MSKINVGESNNQRALEILRARRVRGSYFDRDLFSDPGWDVLLKLYSARRLEPEATVAGLSKDLSIPVTTTSRWVRALKQKGYVELSSLPGEGEDAQFVAMLSNAEDAMTRLFKAFPRRELLI